MPYLVSFLAGIVSWNIFEQKTEGKSGNTLLDVATTALLLWAGYKIVKNIK